MKKFDIKMLNLAFEKSILSNAKKRKVGSILVNNNEIVSTGFNQMPLNTKCENSNGESFSFVIHSEEKTILDFLKSKNSEKNDNLTLYCTYSPCENCAKLIVQVGIKKLVYVNEHKSNFITPKIYEDLSPKDFLESMGVEIVRIPAEELEPVLKESVNTF